MAEQARECTLGPWDLKLVSIGDEISHAIAETTYPYKNGADLEDMGVNPEVFRFSCIITNEDYDKNYSALRNWFLSYFPEPIELYHPDHDTILYGYPKNFSEATDRRKRYAEFNFDFEIANLQDETQAFTDPTDVIYDETVEVNNEVQIAVATEMQKVGVPDIKGDDWSLGDILNAVFEYWGVIADTARTFIDGMNQVIGIATGIIDQVKTTVDAISSSIDYIGSMSGKLTECFQKCCDSFTTLARKISGSSRSKTEALAADLGEMLDSMQRQGIPDVLYAAFATIAAATLANETANHISDDEKRMGESIAAEKVVSDDAEGREIAETKDAYIVTPSDLEDSVATARKFINTVLPVAICPERLKKQAATLTDAVLRFKMEYMTTKKVTLQHETPLHKVCLDNGLGYKAAERLCALNAVKNPTFMNGEVLVYDK